MEGNVQGVGYRVVVRQIARRNRIRGKVKNLDDGSVEIYCEGEDKDSVLKFIEAIKVKSKDDNAIFAINVEEIKEFWEGHEGYIPLEESIKNFKIDYGDEATTPFEKANLEKLDIGSLMMHGLGKNMEVLGSGVEKGFSTTHSDFEKLDDKYDVVSTELKSINNKISNMDVSISKLVDHLGTIIHHFVDDRTTKEKQN